MGFLEEIKNLLKKYSWSDPGLQIAAYKCLRPYFENKNTFPALSREGLGEGLSTCLQKWKYAEHSDARRQSTYLKSRYKEKAQFFDITSSNFKNKILKIISKWYNES
jgi:tRNA A37 N6-isopentenylltransferase MiaA